MEKKLMKPLMLLSLAVVFFFANMSAGTGIMAQDSEPPELRTEFSSNVSNKEFNQIRNGLKHTDAYKAYKDMSMINAVPNRDIIINTVEGENGTYAYVEFMLDAHKASMSDNLVYAQFTYHLDEQRVVSDHGLYAMELDDDYINLKMLYNVNGTGVEVYDVNVDVDGKMSDIDGLEILEEDFIASSELKIKSILDELDPEEMGSNSFCEYALAALCGAGGGAGCYAAAAALGITTGIGGVSLAIVCGAISSVGCTAASDQICG
ncbi:hypothetical protein CR205_03255 [Alteribacter lacisalsi]|uniref:Uncharacterized protein n=1 Tax=Alteribacter lacisalsi TaxID=2045244 RepID=A0A2W0H8Y2_9BACI|nr:halocin C8 precursor-like protein [Alteribacter lacisalsi]PYZ97627.1 hypothetical protein CR205_03255 [Alteribacter lacisalsi]